MATPLRKVYPRLDVPLLLFAATASFPVGLGLPMMRVEKLVVFENEFSVVSGIAALFRNGHLGLGAILLAFSVLFPAAKLVVLWLVWFGGLARAERRRLLRHLKALGKWSMLDVFVVAISVVAVELGPIASVVPLWGIYVFAASVLLSMVATMAIERLTERADKAGL
jgi:paraquat-inducible protein A